MNNRQLLENAARAADIQGKYYIAYGERSVNEGIDTGSALLWNPLVNNFDAFPLMVKLYINIDFNDREIVVNECSAPLKHSEPVEYGGDREQATRLAIVKCAAIIGENL